MTDFPTHIMRMEMHGEPRRVYDELKTLLREVYKHLDAATAAARRDREIRGRPYDPWHFSSVVRNEFRNLMIEMAETDPQLIVLENIPMNGIQLLYGARYALKVRREHDGPEPPPPGSDRQIRYYEQQPLPFPDGDKQSEMNLLILWDLDTDYALNRVLVSRPNGANCVWFFEVPHPVTELATPPIPPAGDDDVLEEHEEIAESNTDEAK